MKTETKEKMRALMQKTAGALKKPNKKMIAAVCAVVLIGAAVAVNLIFFGGADDEAKTEKTGLAVDLTSLEDPVDAEKRDAAVASDDVDREEEVVGVV